MPPYFLISSTGDGSSLIEVVDGDQRVTEAHGRHPDIGVIMRHSWVVGMIEDNCVGCLGPYTESLV